MPPPACIIVLSTAAQAMQPNRVPRAHAMVTMDGPTRTLLLHIRL